MKRLVLFSFAVWLSACGQPGVTEIGDSTGATAQIATDPGASIAAPANLPDFAPIYPGARLTTAIVNPEQPGKGMIVMETADKQPAVIAFYRGKAAAAGLNVVGEMASGDALVLTLQKGEDSSTALSVTAAKAYESEGSMITVHYQVP